MILFITLLKLYIIKKNRKCKKITLGLRSNLLLYFNFIIFKHYLWFKTIFKTLYIVYEYLIF